MWLFQFRSKLELAKRFELNLAKCVVQKKVNNCLVSFQKPVLVEQIDTAPNRNKGPVYTGIAIPVCSPSDYSPSKKTIVIRPDRAMPQL